MDRRLAIFILILLTSFTYANTLKNNFVWDDIFFINNNNCIKDLTFLPQYFYSAKTYTTIPNYHIFRPLRTVTFALEYKFWGLNPFIFHLTNIVLHLLSVLTVYFLVSRLASNRHIGFITALIFSLHPVQTEAVAWIKGRTDLLFALFFLLGFLFFLKKEEKEKDRFYASFIYILYFLALLSKVMAITFPLIILLYKLSLGKKELQSKDKFFLVNLFLISLTYLFTRHLVLGRTAQSACPGGNAYYTFLTMLRVFPAYFKIIIYPANLIADYSGMKISHSIFEPKILFSLLFYLLGIFILRRAWRKNRLIFFGLSFFFLTLLPVSNIIPTMQFMAERFLYLPALGIFLLIALLIFKGASVFSSKKIILWLLTLFLAVNLSILTIDRNGIWRNELSLWQKTFETAPASFRITENLAFAYLNHGFPDKAIPLWEKNFPKSKKKEQILDCLGLAYLYKNDFDSAKKYFEEAIKLKPDFGPAYGHLGALFGLKKEYRLSEKYLEKAIKFDPDSSQTSNYYNDLGLSLKKLGRKTRAKQMFETALLENPDNIEALKNLGAIYWKEKNWRKARAVYQRLSRNFPRNQAFKYWYKRAEENLKNPKKKGRSY